MALTDCSSKGAGVMLATTPSCAVQPVQQLALCKLSPVLWFSLGRGTSPGVCGELPLGARAVRICASVPKQLSREPPVPLAVEIMNWLLFLFIFFF